MEINVTVSEVMNNMMKGMINNAMRQVVEKCALKYGFSKEEALRELGVSVSVSVLKKEKKIRNEKAVCNFPLPFNGEQNEMKCEALRQNNGLYTQCQGEKKEGGFCKSCNLKTVDGIPEYGTISQRLSMDIFNYVDPKGRKPTAYTKVMKKYKLTKEQVLEEATKHGITINEGHFVTPEEPKRGRKATSLKEPKEAKGHKGRPKKPIKVVEIADDDDDLFASLVASAHEAENDEEKEAKKAEEKAEKEKEKAEKEANKAAEKAEKEAKLAAEKAEKEAKLAAEKAEKEAEKPLTRDQIFNKAIQEEARKQKEMDEVQARSDRITQFGGSSSSTDKPAHLQAKLIKNIDLIDKEERDAYDRNKPLSKEEIRKAKASLLTLSHGTGKMSDKQKARVDAWIARAEHNKQKIK